ncbi:hypothetical protein MYSE111917_02910 [Mycobacterium senriense]|uniref:Uncharacterized protein n=1 Tax=Mycobacterium senriense TaxID=2775496 RepID=A0ABN6IIL9_9MYCO|nr:hypothetical protein [Mycobacterium senriense]BCZ23362.1 hypothetical protein MTY59_32170 [Mycobacterium senriense]
MSLIALSAPLIRLAAVDDGYAQDLFEAVVSDEASKAGLVDGPISEDELALLTPSEWQWYATWRQSLDGGLDRLLLNHLTVSVTTRFARFEVRALVLRDRRTNELAPQYDTPPQDESNDTVGLRWLADQAGGQRVLATFRPAESYWSQAGADESYEQGQKGPDDESSQGEGLAPEWLSEVGGFELLPDEYFDAMSRAIEDERLELTIDALQCGTDASQFLIRQLASHNVQPSWPSVTILGDARVSGVVGRLSGITEQRDDAVTQQLRTFAVDRGLNPDWYLRDQPLRND